jgi:CspA family cold shock protein
MSILSRRRFFALLSGLGAAIASVGSSLTTRSASAQPTDGPSTPLDSGGTRLAEVGFKIGRVSGRVSWYDDAKGYGCVAPDDNGEHILLHVTALRASGYCTAKEGARIECLVLRRPNRRQAFQILSMDESTAETRPRKRRPELVKDVGDWEVAHVKWLNRIRGFGFLTRGEGTPDIFFHRDLTQAAGLTELRPGDMVQVRWGRGAKGPMAAELRSYGASSFMTSL